MNGVAFFRCIAISIENIDLLAGSLLVCSIVDLQ